MAIKNRLKEIMLTTKTTQVELAKNIGVSRSNISNIVTGNSLPSLEVAIRMSDYFGVSVNDIFYEELEADIELFIKIMGYLDDVIMLEAKKIISEETLLVIYNDIIEKNIPNDKMSDFLEFKVRNTPDFLNELHDQIFNKKHK